MRHHDDVHRTAARSRTTFVKSVLGMIAFYGALVLIVLALGLFSYFAPVTHSGLGVMSGGLDSTQDAIDLTRSADVAAAAVWSEAGGRASPVERQASASVR